MFTGIVEAVGAVTAIEQGPESAQITITCNGYFADISLGDSVAVNGCCLTAVKSSDDYFVVDVMKQTLALTTTGELEVGSKVNLEKAMKVSDRLGGHIVQGHVDGRAKVVAINEGSDWYEIRFEVDPKSMKYIQAQGSITLNGVSLTVASLDDHSHSLTVWLIPETLARTNLKSLAIGDEVNYEVDVLAKYVERILKAGSHE